MDGERGDKAPAPAMDRRVMAVFNTVSRQVQFLLDHNRLLINEINQNHEAKVPEGLTRNVTLIRQLNSNIGKVVDLYASLSSNFSNVFENLQEVSSDQTNSGLRPASALNGRSAPGAAAAAQSLGQNLHKKLRSADLP
ncbi:hypothetical protein M758_4G065800 [Ceratodon purpureus]|uniref:Protein EARLY FLOWERING 4 domain-containing protein n=1 Tax=Ceratodon purpureus TaxID=3225 RepID=A0A8T0H3C6_CERPU|nr:hypothetical protein KC19_8G125100 [Ceratodon purpureus]KAG0618465.1 hypothetical protein M758_4G065800 [Ceratodon purpureus]